MGVRGVNGPDSRVVALDVTARIPASRTNSVETDEAAVPSARAISDSGEVQNQQNAIDVEKTVSVQRAGTHLSVDKTSDQVVAQIVDENNEVIKQIPPEEALEVAARFRELQGKFFDRQV
jgi:uncharacterized FlaG/YvyC family protein